MWEAQADSSTRPTLEKQGLREPIIAAERIPQPVWMRIHGFSFLSVDFLANLNRCFPWSSSSVGPMGLFK